MRQKKKLEWIAKKKMYSFHPIFLTKYTNIPQPKAYFLHIKELSISHRKINEIEDP